MRNFFYSSFSKACVLSIFVSFIYFGIWERFSILDIPVLKIEDLFFKVRQSILPLSPAFKKFILVVVDDESLKRIDEKWPFSRKTFAEMVNVIETGNPRLIALDFVFSRAGDPADDFLFSEAVRNSGKVILASFVDSEGNYLLPFDELRSAAKGCGVVNKLLDPDLFVRRANLFYLSEKKQIVGWPWELEAAAFLNGLDLSRTQLAETFIRVPSHQGSEKELKLNFYDHKMFKINYRVRASDIPQVPLWKLLNNSNLSSEFLGKIVLAGTTSQILHDYYHTPLGLMPGVVVNLNMLENFLEKDLLKRLPQVFNILLFSLFIWFASYFSLRYDILRAVIFLIILTVAGILFCFFLFCVNFSGNYFAPFLFGSMIFLMISLCRYGLLFFENVRLRGKVVTDPLTGLFNRRALEFHLDMELEKLSKAGAQGSRKLDSLREISFLMIDIDNFKQINDTYGHSFGDDVIKMVAYQMGINTRADDLVARYGGEEFCILLPHTNKQEAEIIGEKIRKGIEEQKVSYVNQIASFTISVGVAASRTDNLPAPRALIRAADMALYEAKRAGKNKVVLYRESLRS